MTDHPQAKPSVILRELEHESVLFDEDSGGTFHLNTSASMIWCLCDGQHAVPSIVRELCAVFPDAEVDRVRAEVESVLARFATDDLLVAPDAGS